MSSDSHLKPVRILGSPFKSPLRVTNNTATNLFAGNSPTPSRANASLDKLGDEGDNEDSESEAQTDPKEPKDQQELICPLCNEGMINLYQLNQHIDDVHNFEGKSDGAPETASNRINDTNSSVSTESTSITDNSISKLLNNDFINTDIKKWFSHKIIDERPPQPNNNQKRKTLSLDLFDNNRGFSLGDGQKSPTPTSTLPQTSRSATASPGKQNSRISRNHWKHISSGNTCSLEGCGKLLSVKNGIVNCRKCGLLFCNEHTSYRIRLRNTKASPDYDTTSNGIWSRCCKDCYFAKPDLEAGTRVNSRDLTKEFVRKRQQGIEDKQLQRNQIIKRFIKLTNQMMEQHLEHSTSWFGTRPELPHNDWTRADNCTICFVQFNILVRRHHCRLCGNSVCDDAYGVRLNCSIMVPLGKLLDKLSHFRYSEEVRQNIETIIKDEGMKFRCCVNCKNLLLYDWKMSNKNSEDPISNEIFQTYDTLLMMKVQVELLLSKFEQLLESSDETAISKHRTKLIKGLKEFEKMVLQLKLNFFSPATTSKLTVLPQFTSHQQILLNIYQGLIEFLQENFLRFKVLNDQFQERESDRVQEIEKQKVLPTASEVQKALTKKQIRELREQLMVMNEQKFIVEQIIQDNIKQRKFEELDSLTENKQELSGTIAELERKLGEFGF